jgi:hypothetical protein
MKGLAQNTALPRPRRRFGRPLGPARRPVTLSMLPALHALLRREAFDRGVSMTGLVEKFVKRGLRLE